MKLILSVDSVKYPLTGIGRYTYELAQQFVRHDAIEDVRFFRGSQFCELLPAPAEGSWVMRELRSRILKSNLATEIYRFAVPRMQARVLRGCADFVFHGPSFYLPPFPGVSVVTIHDLSPFRWTHCHPPERIRYMQKEIKLSLRRARLLITDSEYTRRELAEHFDWPLERICAVPLASAEMFHPRGGAELDLLASRYALVPGSYALFVGTIEPRKNILALLDAYSRLPGTTRTRWPLVLAGYQGWNSDALHTRIEAAVRAGWARSLGFVAADDLPLLYAGARLFVFPSFYEGFGLPVIEAMASGTPVVCSNSSSLPEVAGDAAAMCPAADVDGLMGLIAMGLQDEVWREMARQRGLIQASKFSWRRCAEETLNVYRTALSF